MAIMDFVQRFNTLQAQRETGNELIKDLLIYIERVENGLQHENARLTTELADAHLDLDDSKRSRRDLQQQLNMTRQTLAQSLADCDFLRNRNPYIVVLVDGDGMIFNQDLINQGIEGGKKAANALRMAILEQCSGINDEIEIVTKVCANFSGLSKALKRDGSVENLENFKDFTLGFTQGKANFDFIDVGHGKERADSKIKECTRWHLKNWNCKQILLGISFDSGYAPFLDEINQDDRERITIIEGPPIVRELTATNLPTIKFENIFRSEKLIDRIPESNPVPSPSTWAGVTSIPPPAGVTNSPVAAKATPVTAKKSAVNVTIRPDWVPGPRGLDPPINVNREVLDGIKRRTSKKKLCNNHYLRGPCSKGTECCFEHDYKVTEEDLKAIAYLARMNPCVNGQECTQEDCIYGHSCPSVVIQPGSKELLCTAFACRFYKEDHPPGTTIKHSKKEKEYERY